MLWGPSRHLGSLTAANWVSFDFNVSYSSCWGYSLINTFKLKKKSSCHLAYRMVHRSGRISFQQANRRNSEPIRALHSGTIFGNFVGCRCYITHPHKYTYAINIFHLHSAQLHSGQRGFPKEKTDDLIQRLRVHSYSHILTCTHKLSFAFTYARITRR